MLNFKFVNLISISAIDMIIFDLAFIIIMTYIPLLLEYSL